MTANIQSHVQMLTLFEWMSMPSKSDIENKNFSYLLDVSVLKIRVVS